MGVGDAVSEAREGQEADKSAEIVKDSTESISEAGSETSSEGSVGTPAKPDPRLELMADEASDVEAVSDVVSDAVVAESAAIEAPEAAPGEPVAVEAATVVLQPAVTAAAEPVAPAAEPAPAPPAPAPPVPAPPAPVLAPPVPAPLPPVSPAPPFAVHPAGPPPQGGYPMVPPPPAAFQQQWGAGMQPPAPAKPRSRTTMYASLAVVGFLAIVAGTAGTVVAVGKPGGSSAQAASVPSARATHSAPASPSPTAAPTTPAPVVVPTVAPSPTSTVHGSVDGDSHTGDLRFFLLPIPAGGQVIGDADGTTESVSTLSKEMSDPSQGLGALKSWNCTGGAIREYRSPDGTLTITTELKHFDSDSDASGWVSGLTFGHATSFSVPGIGDATGWAYDPSDPTGYGNIIGVSHDGDVEYEINISGTGKIAHSLLLPLMKREEQLLSTGH